VDEAEVAGENKNHSLNISNINTQHYVIKFVSDLPTLGFICYR
jgi:hypothetical protein